MIGFINMINKINNPNPEFLVDHFPKVEIIIKRDGETVYQNECIACLVNIVEDINDINTQSFELRGRTQTYVVGHPIVVMFAWDQLRQKIEKIAGIATGYVTKLMGMDRDKALEHLLGVASHFPIVKHETDADRTR